MVVDRMKLQKGHRQADTGHGTSAEPPAQDPRELLAALEGLDRQRDDNALVAMIESVRARSILALECAIFEMRVKYRAGDDKSTLQAIDKVLALSPDNIEALRAGGRIANKIGDGNLGMTYWERLARTSANDSEAALQVARIYRRRRQHADALEWARRAADRRTELTEPLLIAVGAAVELGWPASADPLLARLFKMDRKSALAALSRLTQEPEPESLARLLSLFQKQFATDPAISENVGKVYSNWLVAALEHELGSRELDAAAYYRAARSVRPSDANAHKALERLSLPSLVAMRDAFNRRDFSGAVEHGTMAARINPDCLEAWQTLGRAQFALGNVGEAGEACRRCTELNPKDGSTWLTYGLVLNQSGNRRGALQAFQTARGFANAELKGEIDASIVALHPLLVRDSQQAALADDLEGAWASCQAALTIRQGDKPLEQFKHDLLRRLREQIRQAWNNSDDNVAALCRLFLEKVPGDPNVATMLGRTLMKARAYAEALPVWESLARQNPQDSHNHLQIARCCRGLKMRDRGILAAEAALRIGPQLNEAAEIAKYLRGLTSASDAHA